ncbi:MAG: AraC family transcriptional regulator [Planctomycetaceae bacterium]|nr:AraC family transcriptional regulator [Planctomycetaceae bacterium]
MNRPAQSIKKKYTSGKPGKVVEAAYFYYDTAPDHNHNFAIVCGGYEKCDRDFEINRTHYPYYFVKYTVRGRGTMEINGQILPLRPGILTGFEPGTAHHYRADPIDPMEHIFITFLGNQAPDLFRRSTLSENHFIEAANPEQMLRQCRKIIDVGLQKPPFSQEICCHYLHILLLEMAASSANPTARISISTHTYQKCKAYIDDHFSFIQTPGEVAKKCDIDVRYMASLFKKHCHTSPSQYIMALKLNKAANLLLSTDNKIKEIAGQVGFDDPYHFSKNFKQFHGQSPVHYRHAHM